MENEIVKLKNNIDSIKQENIKLKNEKKKLNETNNNNKIKTIHSGIKCNLCEKKPIIGIRYKCSICKDFNLCEECEEKNYRKKIHIHDLIKLRDIEKEKDKNTTKYNNLKKELLINNKQETPNQDDNDSLMNDSYLSETKNDLLDVRGDENIFKEITSQINFNQYEFNYYNDSKQEPKEQYQIANEDDNLKYSYSIDQKEFLKSFNQKTISSISVNFTIQNNGTKSWTRNTKLCCDNTSQLKCDEIKLKPLEKNNSQKVECKFNGLNELEYGKYTIFLNFVVDNILYGEKIKIVLECMYDEKNEKVIKFMKNYNLSFEDVDAKSLKENLEKNNWDFEKTFNIIFSSEAD